MRVCFVTYPAVMLLKGGPKTQLFQTKYGLERLGVEVDLHNPWRELPVAEYDLIHVFGANIGTYHYARELHKLGAPMVISPIFYSRHNAGIVRAAAGVERVVRKAFPGTWMDYGFVRDICNWSIGVLPNTHEEGCLLRDGLGISEEKLYIVPNGVESRFGQGDPRQFIEQYGVKDFVLNVGHVGPERKNVLRLIKAMEKVNAPAVIIGRVEDTRSGRACVAEAKKSGHVMIIDAIPNSSDLLASAYAACDVFALPSYFETPGIAALEAGLAGAKIVITPHGGPKEYFGGHAEYVEPTSWELIAHGITTALNKPKTPDLSEHIKKYYLWERIAELTLEVYGQVMKE